MVLDQYGRDINYLRISLTDRCNLRCVYCMPEAMTFRPRAELLQDHEVKRLIAIFAKTLGFTKVRLTGGEPTLRENIVEIVRYIAETPGVKTVAMTTNGVLLQRLARPLAQAGLQRLNISIDSLNPDKFKQITRWGTLDDVWQGILAAQAIGLTLKLNAVVIRGFNDQSDVIELAKLTQTFPWQIRFIEMMPFGQTAQFQQQGLVREQDLKQYIETNIGPLQLQNNGQLDGEARVYQLRDAPGTLGFISSVSQPFCASCNRTRLTADGRLRLCLLREGELDVLTPLRSGASDRDIQHLLQESIWLKPWGHGLAGTDIPLNREMSQIGG